MWNLLRLKEKRENMIRNVLFETSRTIALKQFGSSCIDDGLTNDSMRLPSSKLRMHSWVSHLPNMNRNRSWDPSLLISTPKMTSFLGYFTLRKKKNSVSDFYDLFWIFLCRSCIAHSIIASLVSLNGSIKMTSVV